MLDKAMNFVGGFFGFAKKVKFEDQGIATEKMVDVYKHIPLLELEEKAYNYYRNNVKGNINTSFDMARRKLTRNVLLARQVPNSTEDTSKQLYLYGCLQILVVDNNKIVWIRNEPKLNKFHKDIKRYKELSIELGIKEEKNPSTINTGVYTGTSNSKHRLAIQ